MPMTVKEAIQRNKKKKEKKSNILTTIHFLEQSRTNVNIVSVVSIFVRSA